MPEITTQIMDGKIVAQEIYSQIRKTFGSGAVRRKPKLAILLIGNDASSLIYIKQKIKACEELGFDYVLDHRSEADQLATDDVVSLVQKYNTDPGVTGLIVQMPLPAHINKREVINAIDPKKDVDGLHPFNMGQTYLGAEFEKLTPCTATGIIRMLEYYKISVAGQKVCVIGSGIIAGKPIAAMLVNRKATVTVCNSRTPDLSEFTAIADIIIVAAGSPALVKADMVRPGTVIVDVGISRTVEGKIVGDTEFDAMQGKVAFISPVPGGVGKLTVACLMENLLKSSL